MTPLQQHPSRRGAFSMVEVIFALLLVGVVFAAAMHTLASARMSQVRTHDHAVAHMLAQEWMSELLAAPFDELAPRSESSIDGWPDWNREARIDWADPDDPAAVAGSPTGMRRISVHVSRGSAELAALVSVRTDAAADLHWSTETIAP